MLIKFLFNIFPQFICPIRIIGFFDILFYRAGYCINLTAVFPLQIVHSLFVNITKSLCGAFFGYAAAPQENNAAYLKHWLTKLKEEPAFLVEILGDVNKAAKMIADKVTEPMNEPAAA